MVILAIVIAVIEAINVISAAKLPGQLASLIDNARTVSPDLTALESSSNGATSLFSMFVGATLPIPTNRTCDNSSTSTEPGLTVIRGVITVVGSVPCLNPTAIPPASPTDPQFVIQAKGATTTTLSPTITWKDTAAGTTTTARLSETWFIDQVNGSTVQTLRIAYTDWGGKDQNAWLLGNPTDGYHFLGSQAF